MGCFSYFEANCTASSGHNIEPMLVASMLLESIIKELLDKPLISKIGGRMASKMGGAGGAPPTPAQGGTRREVLISQKLLIGLLSNLV